MGSDPGAAEGNRAQRSPRKLGLAARGRPLSDYAPSRRLGRSRRGLLIWPKNLRWLLDIYNGVTAGTQIDFDGGEIELLGFDYEAGHMACEQEMLTDESNQTQYRYLWVPERLIRA